MRLTAQVLGAVLGVVQVAAARLAAGGRLGAPVSRQAIRRRAAAPAHLLQVAVVERTSPETLAAMAHPPAAPVRRQASVVEAVATLVGATETLAVLVEAMETNPTRRQ